jgi:prevent-host-death family protein
MIRTMILLSLHRFRAAIGDAVRRVEASETVVLTRHGRAVAQLVPMPDRDPAADVPGRGHDGPRPAGGAPAE